MRRLLLTALCAVGCVHSQPPAPPPASVPVVAGPRAMIESLPPIGPRLRIIATNDFHGGLEPRPDARGAMRGGAAALAGAIRAAEVGCALPECATILLDAGDQFQGTAASNLAFGGPVIEMFNYLGLSAAALGNHEFDWSQDTLFANMKRATYPILGANVRDPENRDVLWIPNDTILRRGPITVGIIGIATIETPNASLPVNVAGLRFVNPVPIIDSIAPALRARGAQVVIVIAHAGANCNASSCAGEIVDLANNIGVKVDAIISGHTHTLVNTIVRGMPIVQARSRGQAIDVVDLAVGPPVTTLRHEVRDVYTDSVLPNPDVADIVRRATERVAPIVNRPITTIAETMPKEGRQFALGNLIADAMRVVGRGNVSIMNNGGIRQALLAGPATYGTLFEIEPFGNTLVRQRIRGSDLRAYFARFVTNGLPDVHISGARVVFHTTSTPGIDSITIGGRPLSDAATYILVQTNFGAAGGDNLGLGSAAISTEDVGIVDLDALIAYLKSLPEPVRAPTEQRFVLKP
jgi:2',3'-cyclic-nucleotide 2'-phosphodiesterase (5'-nucleotidase family)